jgi:hypothetical protein
MKTALSILILISVALSNGGCDSNQYQVVTGPEGALYRFNRKTGVLTLITTQKKAQPAQPQRSEPAQDEGAAALDKPVSWKESKYPGKDLKAKFEMVWREGKLCYKFCVYPYKSLEKAFARKKQDYVYSLMKPGFTIELLDKNCFLVKEVKVNLWSMTKADDGAGVAKELILNSQIDCTRQSYISISGYRIKWDLESEMIDPDAGDYIKSVPIKYER